MRLQEVYHPHITRNQIKVFCGASGRIATIEIEMLGIIYASIVYLNTDSSIFRNI